ncbi:MAG TPA: hypothetical protein VMY41_05900 [Thermohalobaculum sp.]|nr:hypothetical protein [Thermohalobaculum sp.]
MTDRRKMYPRSFIFSNQPFDGGSAAPFGYLACGPSTNVTSFAKRFPDGSTVSLLCIGYLIDLDNVDFDDDQVLADLAGAFPNFARFHEKLNYINGRFSLIVRFNDDWRIYHDATAMRSLYYKSGAQFLVSSHAHLIANLSGVTTINQHFRFYKFGYPGLMSPFEGIQILPANFFLEPTSGLVTRYWPTNERVERVERSLDEAYDVFSHYFLKARDGILARQKPIVSLTAGLDSRTTFAVFKDVGDAEFFSYNESHVLSDSDIKMAKKFCALYEKKYRTITINKNPRDKIEFPEYRHIPNLIECYRDNFGGENLIHIRSNIAEVGNNFYRKMIDQAMIKVNRPSDFIRARSLTKQDDRAAQEYANDRLHEMFQTVGYDPLSGSPFLGYDPLDLFYWEFRATTWHGPLLLGSDFAFDTFVLFNSRVLLEAMLSINETDRRRRSIQRTFVDHHAPKIAGFPINPPMPMGIHRILHAVHWRLKAALNR